MTFYEKSKDILGQKSKNNLDRCHEKLHLWNTIYEDHFKTQVKNV